MSVVRKNILNVTAKFFPPGGWCPPDDPVPPQPSSVTAVLYFYPPQPPWVDCAPQNCLPRSQPLTATVNLTLGSDGFTWSGSWDSSVAEGRVDWFIYSAGNVVAAQQGNFVVRANNANLSVH